MSYIRYGTKLPSGKTSRYYVIGDGSALVSFEEKQYRIPYDKLKNILNWKEDFKIKKEIGKRLNIKRGEELEIICEKLFDERKEKRWE